ncbi:MAG: hypothetical protein K6U87_11915 [Firmicutes bacterium]|nr:hypothetical protein [Bacillota bacterium]
MGWPLGSVTGLDVWTTWGAPGGPMTACSTAWAGRLSVITTWQAGPEAP